VVAEKRRACPGISGNSRFPQSRLRPHPPPPPPRPSCSQKMRRWVQPWLLVSSGQDLVPADDHQLVLLLEHLHRIRGIRELRLLIPRSAHRRDCAVPLFHPSHSPPQGLHHPCALSRRAVAPMLLGWGGWAEDSGRRALPEIAGFHRRWNSPPSAWPRPEVSSPAAPGLDRNSVPGLCAHGPKFRQAAPSRTPKPAINAASAVCPHHLWGIAALNTQKCV
jgi:hypothetical protein